MGWLDALRGVAALVVVFDHSSYSFMAEFRRELMPEFNTSRYGIMVFFLVSGYIIPASLERRGSIRTFWIGRVFRMYPLWAAVVAAVLAANLLGFAEIRDFDGQSAATVAVAHLTLLQELLGTPNLLLVLWTLSYEMALYLLVVALFTVRQHQRSAAVAVILATLAAVSAAAGVTLSASSLSGRIDTGLLIALASIAMVVAICPSRFTPDPRPEVWDAPLAWIDDNRLAVWGFGVDEHLHHGVRIYDVERHEETDWFPGPTGQLTSDGTLLYALGPDLTVYDIATGHRLLSRPGFTARARHPHTGRLLTISGDGETEIVRITKSE